MKKIKISLLTILLIVLVKAGFSQIEFNLQQVPFSARGAYFAFSQIKDRQATDTLYLHHFIGLDTRTLFSFHPVDRQGKELNFVCRATPTVLTLETDKGNAMICFENDKIIRITTNKIGLKLKTDAFRVPMYLSEKQFRLPGYNRYDRLMVTNTKGDYVLTENSEIDESKFDIHYQTKELGTSEILLYSAKGDNAELVLEEYVSEWKPKLYNLDFEDCKQNIQQQYNEFLTRVPKVSPQFGDAQQLAMYINWSSMVRARGMMKREGMLMSKNWMNYLWSWDNCFNAMGMAHSHPEIAWNQIMVEFENQDEMGILPDRFRDVFIHYGFTKPPVYGIAIDNLTETGIMNRQRLEEVYQPMVKLTNFWLNYRDDDKDGLPQYHHGNDSGWDNGTVFDIGYPVEGPDLASFLVLQMDALSNLAQKLGKTNEAQKWTKKADNLAANIVKTFWKDNKFVYLHYPDGAYNKEGNSLLSYIPMLLGDRLPADLKKELVTNFKNSRFLTEYGVATEATDSPLYEADGYWRGPVWAPSTFLIVEGLKNCGEEKLAKEVAFRFCKLCRKSGFAENYNALSGAPLRDNGYTWTTNVFLSFMYEYDF